MTITLHWWHFPTLVTALYAAWALLPKYSSSIWGDLDTFFGHAIGLFLVAVSWAAFAVGYLLLS